MKTYYIDVHSDGWGTTKIYKVNAETEKEAIQMAKDNWGDLYFNFDVISEKEALDTSKELYIDIEEI